MLLSSVAFPSVDLVYHYQPPHAWNAKIIDIIRHLPPKEIIAIFFSAFLERKVFSRRTFQKSNWITTFLTIAPRFSLSWTKTRSWVSVSAGVYQQPAVKVTRPRWLASERWSLLFVFSSQFPSRLQPGDEIENCRGLYPMSQLVYHSTL